VSDPRRTQKRTGRRTGVDVDALPPGDGVHADNGVHGLDRLAADREASCAGAIRLGHGTVQGGQALEVFLEPRAEGRIESVSA
jgi:hypothetical protein